MRFIKFYFPVFIFALLISIPLLIPYVHPGYFPTHDGEWAVVRLSDMFRELRDLQIPARYSGNLNFGFGYPLFNFTYPLPYYLGIFIHLFGVGFVDTIKILFAVTIPLSAFFMLLASRKIWGNSWAGIISAVLYLYFPYRLVDLYVRGSIGESFAFMIFPLIIFSLVSIYTKPESKIFRFIGSVSYAALIMSHNIMAILFTLTLGFFILGYIKKKDLRIIRSFIFVILFGLSISAFFWIPALFEKSNILLSQVPIADRNLYFVKINQLLNSPWGYGTPTDPINPFTYQIGWPFILILIAVLVVFILRRFGKLRNHANENLAIALFSGFFIFAFLLFKDSEVLWKLPLISEINYPWVVLSQLGLIASLLAGYLSNYKYFKFIAFGAIFLALSVYIPYAKPSMYVDRGDGFYFTNDATTTSSQELMPLWVKDFPNERPQQKVEFMSGTGQIENIYFNSKEITFNANIEGKSVIRINTIYYPGWELTVDNSKNEINYANNKGVMDFSLDPGKHAIKASFKETPLRKLSNIISLAGIILLLLLLLQKKWKF